MRTFCRGLLFLLLGLLPVSALPGYPGERTAGGYADWVTRSPEHWPRIAMLNRILFTDSNHSMAGSAFLLRNDDEIVAVTAKHVLRYFKSETMDSVAFRDTLIRWEMFPKDAPLEVTVIGELINEDPQESLERIRTDRDWILFTIEQLSDDVEPLRLRTTPLLAGETVFVVGWRYTDEGRQFVYRGRYVRSEGGTLLIDVPQLADNTMPGLSGAPVIDGRGYVVGMMSSKSGDLQRLSSTDYPKEVLKRRSRPISRPRIETGQARRDDCAVQMAEHFRRSGWVGITPYIDAEGTISVTQVFANSPADKGGVQRGDIIRGLNGVPVDGARTAFETVYNSLRPGIAVIFDLERAGRSLSVEVRIEPIPEAMLERWIESECP